MSKPDWDIPGLRHLPDDDDPGRMLVLCAVLIVQAVVFLAVGLAIGYWCR